jgi:hypothetical protein
MKIYSNTSFFSPLNNTKCQLMTIHQEKLYPRHFFFLFEILSIFRGSTFFPNWQFNSIAGYLYSLSASTLSKQWDKVYSSLVSVLSWTRHSADTCLYWFIHWIKPKQDIISCAADGALLGKNCGLVPPSPSHRGLCTSIQGSVEILVISFHLIHL